MTSWRDDASAEAQRQLDELLAVALEFAQSELLARGTFSPYAASIGHDGEPTLVAGLPGESRRPQPADIIAICVEWLASTRDELHATAVVSDVRASDGDAICVELEHADGHALTVVLPYSRRRFPRSVTYGDMRAHLGDRRVWPDT